MEASLLEVASPSIYKLGDDELVHIFSRLPLDERLRAAAVSRRFRGLLSSSAQLWKTVSFEGVSRPLTFSALESVCRLAGDKLKTLDVREATGEDKTWLLPETDPPHVEEESAALTLRKMAFGASEALFGAMAFGQHVIWPVVNKDPEPEGATFPDATAVRLPFLKDQNTGLVRFVAWKPEAPPDKEAPLLSLREATAVALNMSQQHYLSARVHASRFQALRVVELVSSFQDAAIFLHLTRYCIEDTHEDDEADTDAMDALCGALRADTRGRIKCLAARSLDIDNAQATTLAGAVASVATCGLRSLDLDENEIDDEGATSVVRILLDRASRHIPLVVSMRHQKKALSAAGRAAMMEAVAADASANLQLRL